MDGPVGQISDTTPELINGEEFNHRSTFVETG